MSEGLCLRRSVGVTKPSPSTQIMYYLYVIKNRSTEETYIGYTEDLKRRLRQHREKRPDLVYYEAYKAKEDAINREKKLKQRGQSIRWLKQRLMHSLK